MTEIEVPKIIIHNNIKMWSHRNTFQTKEQCIYDKSTFNNNTKVIIKQYRNGFVLFTD